MEFKHINLDYLKEMSGGDRNMIKEMIDIYASEIPGYLERMNRYLETGDAEALGRLAHKAKASAQIMGAKKIAEDLRELENIASEGRNKDLYAGIVESITRQFTLSIDELKKVAETL
ncbi:MAG: Hpt domain-containing protein [Marinilabiliales bacterium]|nr:MAG: Hpt domain-containing protein [Marinilabiliales bacterium]